MTKDEQITELDRINKELLRIVLDQSRYIRAMEDAQKVKRIDKQ